MILSKVIPLTALITAVNLQACAPQSPKTEDALTQRGRELTQYLYKGQVKNIWEQSTPIIQAAFKTQDTLKAMQEDLMGKLGKETQVLEERAYPSRITFGHYYRKVTFENLPNQPMTLYFAINPENQVAGFSITQERKAAESPYLNYTPHNIYNFPIKENALIYWGGRHIEENYHVIVANQRFAYDIITFKKNKTRFNGGKDNTDYPCFGTPIYAPAAGTVVATENTIDDNIPGQVNSQQILGNHVIIDHGQKEYSVMAHFKKGSVSVVSGQRVNDQIQIGECGNSGQSTEPHLHYHLQDAPDLDKAQGKPVVFSDIWVNGTLYQHFEPRINQIVGRQRSKE